MTDDPHERDRTAVLHELEARLDVPMALLSAVWLVLFIVELTRGLTPMLEAAGLVIWGVFLLEFALRLALAPAKWAYLRHNVLTIVSLVVPAFRVLRVFRAARILRAARAARGLRLVKVVGALNRGMRTLGRTFARRGVGYVLALTLLVVLAGAAGILSFERDVPGSPIRGYWDAVWWTAMLVTTMGSDYFPRSPEGRLLCVLIATYAFAMFGYVTATLATFFIDRDAAVVDRNVAGRAALADVSAELRALRAEIARLHEAQR